MSGQTIRFSASDVDQPQTLTFGASDVTASAPQAPAPAPAGMFGAFGNLATDVVKGIGKGAANTALDLGQLIHLLPGVSAAVDKLYGQPGLSDQSFSALRPEYANPAQMAGGMLETLGELALPASKAVDALPSAARAGQKFQKVMGAAKDIPINIEGPGQVALRVRELADRGGSMPKAVNDFLKRVTDPNKAEMTYKEARDFASNISRLSANEYQRLTPVIAKEVSSMRVALNQAVADAAKKAGKLAEYRSAMREYAHAKRIEDAVNAAIGGAKKALPYATVGGGVYWMTEKLRRLLGE